MDDDTVSENVGTESSEELDCTGANSEASRAAKCCDDTTYTDSQAENAVCCLDEQMYLCLNTNL